MSFERVVVLGELSLVLLVKFESSEAGILVKIRNPVHLMALALSDVLQDLLRLL